MADVRLIKRKTGAATLTTADDGDRALLSDIGLSGLSGGAAGLWDDASTTTITVGGGTSETGITLSGDVSIAGDLTVNGSQTTANTTDATIADVDILMAFANDGGAATDAGIAIERNGSDAVILWSETNSQFELGLFDTTDGTSVPSGFTTYADLRAGDLRLVGSAITADGALELDAQAGNLTFTSLGQTVTFNEAGDVSLDGAFSATSIIGAINEVNDVGNNNVVNYTNGNASTIEQGQAVYVTTTAQEVDLADATADDSLAEIIGFVSASTIATSASGRIAINGKVQCALVTGLSPSDGDPVFLSTTAGECTTSAPSTSGNVVQFVGYITDASTYTDSGGISTRLVTLQMQIRDKSVV